MKLLDMVFNWDFMLAAIAILLIALTIWILTNWLHNHNKRHKCKYCGRLTYHTEKECPCKV